MAVLKEVEVNIAVNDQNLEECDDPDETTEESSDLVVKYIEVVSEAEYSIKFSSLGGTLPEWRTGPKYEALLFKFYVDGQHIGGYTLKEHEGQREKKVVVNVQENGSCREQPLLFAKILTTEEQTIAQQEDTAFLTAELGKIVVEVNRVCNGRLDEGYRGEEIRLMETITEKALKGKALSHGTRFGPGKTVENPTRRLWDIIAEDQASPFATFEFRYRSKKALQHMLIIPRSPSPMPLEDRPIESLTREELMELVQQRRKNRPSRITARKFKHERDLGSEDDEAHAPPRKSKKKVVIDLLDED